MTLWLRSGLACRDFRKWRKDERRGIIKNKGKQDNERNLKFPFGPIPLTDSSTIETSWRSRLAPLFQSVLYVLPHRGIAVEGERVKISFFQQHDPQNSSRSREEEGGTDGLCVHFFPAWQKAATTTSSRGLGKTRIFVPRRALLSINRLLIACRLSQRSLNQQRVNEGEEGKIKIHLLAQCCLRLFFFLHFEIPTLHSSFFYLDFSF